MIASYRMDGDYPDPAWTDEGRFRAECLFMALSGPQPPVATCRLLALSGRHEPRRQCPFLGVQRT